MFGALKLGIAVGLGYYVGGMVGARAVEAISPTAGVDARTGAAWGGRIVVGLGILWVLA